MSAPIEAQTVPASRTAPWTVPGRRANPLASLRAHRWFALLIASSVSALGLATAIIFVGHEYEAEARIRVSPTFAGATQAGAIPFNSETGYRGFVQQQVAEIDSYATASAALKLLGDDRAVWQRPDESDRRAAERLSAMLDVNPITDTYLISVALTGKRAEGLARIVNAVATAYLSDQQRRELNGSDQRVQMLAQHRAALEKESAFLRARENKIAQELGVSTFVPGFVSPYDRMLGEANGALDAARRATIEAQARLAALGADQQREQSLEVDSTAEQMLANDTELNDARAQLTKQRETIFLELQRLGPNHPGRAAMEQQIQDIDDEIGRLNGAAIERLRAILHKSRETRARRDMFKAEADVDQARRAQEGIGQLVEDLRARAASFGAKYSQAVAIDGNLARDSAKIQQIDEQIGMLRMETQEPGFVSLESAAMSPDLPVKGKRRKVLALFLAAAMLLAVLGPTELDMIDPRIKTAGELEAILGFPPFGAALGDDGRAAGEALRRIALGIARERRASGTRTFVLTPVSAGAATSELTFALARELNDIGISAIAIEAGAIKSELTYVESGDPDSAIDSSTPLREIERENAALSEENGIGPVSGMEMAGGAAPVPAAHGGRPIIANELENGHAMTSVPDATPIQPSRGRGSRLMIEPMRNLLERVLAAHDIVLFDAPPLLASADAEMLIQTPTGAILVVQTGHDVTREVRAAAQLLERIAPPVVGTVMAHKPMLEAAGGSKIDSDSSPLAIFKRWLSM